MDRTWRVGVRRHVCQAQGPRRCVRLSQYAPCYAGHLVRACRRAPVAHEAGRSTIQQFISVPFQQQDISEIRDLRVARRRTQRPGTVLYTGTR